MCRDTWISFGSFRQILDVNGMFTPFFLIHFSLLLLVVLLWYFPLKTFGRKPSN
jgi:hypothetical protein